MVEGRTVSRRLSGWARGERVERKFFALAAAPSLLLWISDELGWQRGALWETWMWLSLAWAVFMIAYMFVSLARSMRIMSVRHDEWYDREGKFLLPPEYRTSESATRSRRKQKQ
jgi:hypothetical protein